MDQKVNAENAPLPEEKKGPKKNLFLIIGGLVVVLLIIGSVVFFLLKKDGEETPDETPDEIEQTTQTEAPEAQMEPVLEWSVTFEDAISDVAISPDGTTIASGSGDTVFMNLLEDSTTDQIYPFERTVESLDYSNDGEMVAVGLDLYGSRLISSSDGTVLQELDGGYNNRVSFSPDGQYVATGDRSGEVAIYDANTGEIATTLESDGADWVQALAYDTSGTLLGVTHQDGTTNIWDLESEEIVKTLELEGLMLEMKSPFLFSPDGEIMAGAGKDEMLDVVKVWSVENYEEQLSIEVDSRIRDIAFSPDGNMIGVTSQDATAIYDTDSGLKLYTVDQTFEDGASDWNVSMEFVTSDSFVIARYSGTLECWVISEVDN